MAEQVVGKQVDLPCSVSHHVNTFLGLTSIALAIILPTVCGPVMAGLVHLVCWVINSVQEAGAVAPDTRKLERQNLVCILSLTLVFLPTYISSMILAELYLNIDNIFLFVIVKYILGKAANIGLVTLLEYLITGTSQHFLVPLCILMTKPDIWDSAREVSSCHLLHC